MNDSRKIKFSIPYNGDIQLVNKIIELNLESKIYDIYRFKQIADKFNSKIKIMVNEGCIIGCLHRESDLMDAQSYSIQNAVRDYITNPEEIRSLIQPCRNYMNVRGIKDTNLIHPNNLKEFIKLNPICKIVGRSLNISKISDAVNAYLNMEYDGDLRNIVENFKYSMKPLFSIENSKPFFITHN